MTTGKTEDRWHSDAKRRTSPAQFSAQARILAHKDADLSSTHIANVETDDPSQMRICYAVPDGNHGWTHVTVRIPFVAMTDPRLFTVWAEQCIEQHNKLLRQRARVLCQQRREIVRSIEDLPEEFRGIALGKKRKKMSAAHPNSPENRAKDFAQGVW